MQMVRKLYEVGDKVITFELGPNEFYDKTDRVGLFSYDNEEPVKFLSIESVNAIQVLSRGLLSSDHG